MKYRTTGTCLPAIMVGYGYGCLLLYWSSLLRHSSVGETTLEAAARQPREKLQRLREDCGIRQRGCQ